MAGSMKRMAWPDSPTNKKPNGDKKKNDTGRGAPKTNSQFSSTPAAYASGHGAKPQRESRAGEPSEGMNHSAEHCQNAADWHRYSGVGGGTEGLFSRSRGYGR